jgi:hypothetical protein
MPLVKIKNGCRVKIIRRNVYHIASAGQRMKIPCNVGNSYSIYGTVVAGSLGRRGWDVQFDIFPLENHTIKNIDRKKMITVASDEEEKEYDRPFDNQSLPSTFNEPAEKRTGKPKTTQDKSRTYMIQRGKTSESSNFEYESGNVSSKFFPRPQISHFLYEYLPLIDEHNKHRQ